MVATTNGTDAVYLSWKKPDGEQDISKYCITYSPAEENKAPTCVDHIKSRDDYSEKVENLLPGTLYNFSITAQNEDGKSEPVAVQARTGIFCFIVYSVAVLCVCVCAKNPIVEFVKFNIFMMWMINLEAWFGYFSCLDS